MPFVVTNKHVVVGHATCNLTFTGMKSDGSADLDHPISVNVADLAEIIIPHPDPNVDLAIFPIGVLLAEFQKQGTIPFIKYCDDSIIPTADAFAQLSPLEDVLTVGFPGNIWDTKHNLPIFQRGITATPAYVDFQGEKKFLIDAAVRPGASGSPVYLYEQGAFFNSRTDSTFVWTRAILLGIVFAAVVQDVTGKILAEVIPTNPRVNSNDTSNLGVCVRSSRIFDFQPLLIARGAKVPDGFKVRTSDS